MLTSDDIRKAAQKLYDNQEFQCGWGIGAGWANEQNEKELAALRAENAQYEKELAALRAENARLTIACDAMSAELDRIWEEFEIGDEFPRTLGWEIRDSTTPDPLYASAPEMLNVLESVLGWIKEMKFEGGSLTAVKDSLSEIIARAKGETA